MAIHLKGRAVLVTGASQGVGRAIAIAMAEAGADIVVHGRAKDEAAEETAEACRRHQVDVQVVAGELGGPGRDGAQALFDEAITAMPRLDTLVNNAGGYFDKPFLEMDEATFLRTLQLNVHAPYFLTQCFARHWVGANIRGRVLMTGSINGRLSETVHSAYDTSKGAIEAMVRTLCVELAPRGIRVNGMAPGLVYTPLTAPALDQPQFRRWMELHTPSGEVPGPDVCGGAAVFLCSDAAHHIQGQMLLVDGGMSIWQQPDLPA